MIKLKDVAPGSTSFLDTTVSLYETYTYAIEVKMENYISDRSDTVQVTIGPFNIYAADFWDNSIRIISWDGNHLITTSYVSSPRSMSLRRTDNRFCVADYYDRSLLLITTDLLEIESIPLPDYPLDNRRPSQSLVWLSINPYLNGQNSPVCPTLILFPMNYLK